MANRAISDLLVPGLVAGVFGLVGVIVGGWITSHNQKKERIHRNIREQLDKFYYPMVGLRARQVAKSDVRTKLSGAVGVAWQRLVQRVSSAQPDEQAKALDERIPDFEKVIEENNRELIEGILPLYRQMVDIFTDNMGLAESSTRAHYGDLVEFIDIWDRWLKGTLAPDILAELGHSEDKLHPFYQDLFAQLDQLSKRLNE